MKMSENVEKLAEALAKAQGAMKNAIKDSANDYFRSRYADLASVWDACREPLSKNGLSVIQVPEVEEGKVMVRTMLLHSSGQWISGELGAAPVKNDPQGIGSVITYLKRYSLSGLAGVATEDDDGNAASGNKAGKPETPAVSFKKPAPPTADPLVKAIQKTLDKVSPEEKLPIDGEGCISQGEAVNLHRAFKEALKPEQQKFSKDLLKEWLRYKGIVNVLGEASTLAIRKESYDIIKHEALEHARSL